MWKTLNQTWLELSRFELCDPSGDAVLRFLARVKHRSLLFNGAYSNTMLRNDAFWFVQIGTYLVSLDVSLHEKRHALEACRTALKALLDEINSAPRPTR
jgi:uncharacterized alpha-E superfamily protein